MNKGQISLLAAIIGGASIIVSIVGGFFIHSSQTNNKIGGVSERTAKLETSMIMQEKEITEIKNDVKELLKRTPSKTPDSDYQDWINAPAKR